MAISSSLSTAHPTSSSSLPTPTLPAASTSPSPCPSTFEYAIHQPSPTKDQQHSPDSSTSPTHLSLGDFHYLEPGQLSSGASTLVGSPMTPRFNSQGHSTWLSRRNSQNQQPSRLSPVSSSINPFDQEEISSTAISTLKSSSIGRRNDSGRLRRFSQGANELEDDESSLVGPINTAKTLGYHCGNKQSLRTYFHGQPKNNAREPHVSITMNDISLETFASQSQIGASSSTSMVTLLDHNNTSSAKSNSSMLFGGLLQKSRNSSNCQKLQDEEQSQHQAIAMSSEGKAYSKRPKPRQIGKKKGEDGKGDGGNGGRKALFSNERTFIQWIKSGLLLGTTALTLCNFGTTGSIGFYIGVSILAIAMSSLAYAATIFHHRDRSLSRRLRASIVKRQLKRSEATASGIDPAKSQIDSAPYDTKEVRYYDRLGPTLLCSTLLIAYSINLYLSVTQDKPANKNGGLGFFQF
ncbi:vacuolar transporter chaperone [Mortierella sp. AM989]|nr:vacuolar transporter chaperone [Mortierella sp. AM989]